MILFVKQEGEVRKSELEESSLTDAESLKMELIKKGKKKVDKSYAKKEKFVKRQEIVYVS